MDYQFIKMVLDHYKTTLAVVLVLFFSSIALVPFGFIGGEFLPNQMWRIFGSNRIAKRCVIGTK
jgi:multidrug efflux pump subunit AcrB